MFCKEQVARLRRETEAIHAKGAELVVVGNGSVAFARDFAHEAGLATPLYTDPSGAAYRALGLRRGAAAALNPRVLANAWRALRGGFYQTSVRGDPLQLGGVLVVLRGGRIAYRYGSRAAGDHPPLREVLAALPAADGVRG